MWRMKHKVKTYKLRIIWFWCVAFFHIIKHTLKNQHWNMAYVDLDYGVDETGKRIRKQ